MSDYIPTTGEVRIAHWKGTAFRSADHVREDAAFDRWLAEHDRKKQAQAWEEGYENGYKRATATVSSDVPANPYQQGAEQVSENLDRAGYWLKDEWHTMTLDELRVVTECLFDELVIVRAEIDALKAENK